MLVWGGQAGIVGVTIVGRVPCSRHLKAPSRYCSYVRYGLPRKSNVAMQ